MKTPEKIKEALQRHKDADCGHCPYYFLNPCSPDLIDDTLALIDQLEKKVEDAQAAIQERDRVIYLMKEQLRGACRVCRNKEEAGDICKVCCDDEFVYHPLWEYEGLPGA